MKARSSLAPPSVTGAVSAAVANCGSFPRLVAWPKVAARRRSGVRVPNEPSGRGPT